MRFAKVVSITLVLFAVSFSLKARQEPIRPLHIGEKVPDLEFNMYKYKKPVVKLSEYKGKLVILDFWHRHCMGCIKMFPKMDELQKKFNGELQVILVNTDNAKYKATDPAPFLEKWYQGHPDFSLYTATDNKIARDYFPHLSQPHYVWISGEGKLQAITGAESVTAENIQKALSGPSFSMKLKKDYLPGQLFDIPTHQVLIDNNLPAYKLFRKGRIDDMESTSGFNDAMIKEAPGVRIRGWGCVNKSLLDLYNKINLFYTRAHSLPSEPRLILDVRDSSGLLFNAAKDNRDKWEKKNLYTYNLIVPENEIDNDNADSLYTYMLDDLNHYSAYHGRFEKRRLKEEEVDVLIVSDKR